MTSHDTILRLAAVAMDFPLGEADRERLSSHLGACASCAHRVVALRADAVAIAGVRVRPLTDRREAEILDAVLRPGPVVRPARLLLVAALLAAALLGSLLAGSRLLRDDRPLLVEVPSPPAPSPIAELPTPTARAVTLGGLLAVTRADGSGRTWVETVDVATGVATRLGDGSDPAWMGRLQLAFACAGVGGDFDGVCFVRRADAAPSTIASGADDPAVSPDGRRVVIHRGAIDVGETWLVGADGNGLAKVANGAFLRWSPDGSTLLGQPEGAEARVATINPDGTGLRVLAMGYDAAWSPDGGAIAHVVVAADGTSQLRIVNVATGVAETLLTVESPREIRSPAWLPDGRLVVVLDGDLWRVDAEDPEPVRLTAGLDVRTDETSGRPTVDAGGDRVAFSSGQGASARVGIASVDGGSTILDLGDGPATQPAWAPDGATLGDGWTEADVPATPERPVGTIAAVTAGGPGFVAVGTGCDARAERCEAVIWTSTDGRAWSRVPSQDATELGFVLPTSGPMVGLLDVAAGAPGVVAIGYAAAPNLRPTAWFSPDAVTWTRTTLAPDLDHRPNAVTWDGTRFVIVGEDRDPATSAATISSARGRAAAWTSTDGRTWSAVADPALAAGGLIDTMEDPASGGAADVTAGPDGLVAVGSTCTSSPAACSIAAWRSADGEAWQRADLPVLAGRLISVAAYPGGYVASGVATCDAATQSEQGCPAVLLASADGRTWDRVAFPQVGELGQVTGMGDRVFLVAPFGSGRLWVSPDGRSWTRATVQGGSSPSEPGVDATNWRFAARDEEQVWLGTAGPASDPAAWYAVTAAP